MITVWRDEPAMRSSWHLGHQQAASQQANLALESKEVRINTAASDGLACIELTFFVRLGRQSSITQR